MRISPIRYRPRRRTLVGTLKVSSWRLLREFSLVQILIPPRGFKTMSTTRLRTTWTTYFVSPFFRSMRDALTSIDTKTYIIYRTAHFCGILVTATTYFLLYCAYTYNQPFVNVQSIAPAFVSGALWGIAQYVSSLHPMFHTLTKKTTIICNNDLTMRAST